MSNAPRKISKLRKSIKTYRQLVEKIPSGPGMTRTLEFQQALEYSRSLYREFGRDRVREALRHD